MKVGLGIVGVVAVIVLAYAYSDTQLATTPKPEKTAGAVITLTEDGFTPATLTVDPGTEVMFVSKTGSFFWPASNPHPTHTIYSAFDPQEPIRPEGSWNFVFTQPGIWRYHDHLAPYFTGTITVSPRAAQ